MQNPDKEFNFTRNTQTLPAMKKNHLSASAAALVFIFSCGTPTRINVDPSVVENAITPWLYGSCIEDVNHEIYGGLYDQKIFGESFEEPAGSPDIVGFSRYDGFWSIENGVLSVASAPGAKLVYNGLEIADGTVEVDMRFDGTGVNGGVLVRVSDPGTGADNFNGYEINVSADGKRATLGRHRMDWKFLAEAPVDVDPAAWNKLSVGMHGSRITVALNGQTVIDYDDTETPLLSGKAAIRIWNADSSYRNFAAADAGGTRHEIAFEPVTAPEVSATWDAVITGDAVATFEHDGKTSYNTKYSQVIEMTGGTGRAGVANMSLNRWGIAVNEDQRFAGSVYLKSKGLTGSVKIAIESADGTKQYAAGEIKGVNGKWNKYTFELTSSAKDPKSRFTLYIDKPGKLWIDQATLMTTGDSRFQGLPLRADIGQAMVDQGLTFLRYGGSMVNVPDYKWKNMIGDRGKRPIYKGNWYAYSTNGFGIEEFLMFCETAGFVPSFAVSVLESAEDMADMIEYLNGPVESPWGGKRAEAGHPEPYGVKYIQIGNEEVIHSDDRAGYERYIEQFNRIYDAIHAKDPNVVFINAAWWRPKSGENMKMVFDALNGKAAYWDYHPWADALDSGKKVDVELQEMRDLFTKWDPETTMKCALFEENGNTHNMQRALGHATIQNAARRHGEFLLTTCAANALQPYGQNDNGWDQGQVFFTPDQVWGMPPYYAQQMASRHHRPLLIQSTADERLDVTATTDEKGREIVLHVVNTSDQSIKSSVRVAGTNVWLVKSVTLAAELSAVNTTEQPERVVPVEKSHKGKPVHDFPPHSYTILVLQTK